MCRACSGTDTCSRVQMPDAHRRHRPRGEGDRRDLGEPLGVDPEHHLGQQAVERSSNATARG